MRSGAIRLMRDRLGWMMKPHHAYRTRRERQQLRWRIRDIWFYNSQKTVKKFVSFASLVCLPVTVIFSTLRKHRLIEHLRPAMITGTFGVGVMNVAFLALFCKIVNVRLCVKFIWLHQGAGTFCWWIYIIFKNFFDILKFIKSSEFQDVFKIRKSQILGTAGYAQR